MSTHASDFADSATSSTASGAVSLKFDSMVLVCGDCEKRSNGPTRLSTRDVRKDLKHHLSHAKSHKFRVVQCSCIGSCPKKAIAVVAMVAGAPLLAGELKSDADVTQFAALAQRQR